FYGTMDRWIKAVHARTGELLWQFQTASGIIGQPITFRGPGGKQYVAVLDGVGGWAGAIVSAGLDARDQSAGGGFVNAMRDDPRLRGLRVGVQLIGNDGVNTPPAHALSRRGIVDNVRGFSVYADYAQPNPPARILDALIAGEIDVAVVWGPLAGYFALRLPA